LESDRSHGYINEKAEDWPSWTVEESNTTTEMKEENHNTVVEVKKE
jgi:hypothetical protein